MTALDRHRVSKTVRALLDELRPADPAVRAKLDYGFRFHRQSVELVELRPSRYRAGNTEHAFAKATFVKSSEAWKVYWKRGSGKWHPHDPPKVPTLAAFLKLVKADKHRCFFG